MSEEYEIKADYQTAKWRAIEAILSSQCDIRIEDVMGRIEIYQGDKRLATINLEEHE